MLGHFLYPLTLTITRNKGQPSYYRAAFDATLTAMHFIQGNELQDDRRTHLSDGRCCNRCIYYHRRPIYHQLVRKQDGRIMNKQLPHVVLGSWFRNSLKFLAGCCAWQSSFVMGSVEIQPYARVKGFDRGRVSLLCNIPGKMSVNITITFTFNFRLWVIKRIQANKFYNFSRIKDRHRV